MELQTVYKRLPYTETKEYVPIDVVNKSVYVRIDPEEWYPVTEMIVPDILLCYMVSTWGRFYNIYTRQFLQYSINKDGYGNIMLNTTTKKRVSRRTHRVVMLTFCPIFNSDMYEVNHMNGNKLNNNINNLEWCTRRENVLHSVNTGLQPIYYAEDNPNAKLSNDQVRLICEGLALGITYKDICEDLGLEYTQRMSHTLQRIRTREIWTSISKDYIFSSVYTDTILTDDQLHFICQSICNNITKEEIYNLLGYNDSNSTTEFRKAVYRIYSQIIYRRAYKRISQNYNF